MLFTKAKVQKHRLFSKRNSLKDRLIYAVEQLLDEKGENKQLVETKIG